MSLPIFLDSFSSLLPEGIAGPVGLRPWDAGQAGPQDVRRDQVLDKPYLNFGKLMLPDKLAFCAAAVALSRYVIADKEMAAITFGLCAGSLSTDLRYMESMLAGFPSPAIFSATLPSSAIADIAIYFGLKGPNRVIAGNAASGLTAFERAVSLLETDKAASVLSLSVNAVEPADAGSPLLDPAADRSCRAYAFLLTTTPQPGGLGMKMKASFTAGDDRAQDIRDELYFTEFVRLLSARKNGRIVAASCDVAATLELQKEP
jgi:hypothetical protein